MSYDNQHDWLSLIEISGPFLAVPVLKEVFPQGLDELSGSKRKRVRQAYEEWRDALELDDEQFPELHAAWIDEVLSRCLELDEDSTGDVLKRSDWCSSNLQASLLEHGVTLSPDFAVVDEQHGNKPLLLIQAYMQDVDLDATFKQGGWAATPAERMVQLCRTLGCRLGLVTNGERWMLVDAPVGAVTTFANWYARIWNQEPVTLQAFLHLLGIRRFFVDKAEQLPALLDRSLKFQDEVTDALGEQVRRAVEVLIQSLDKADQDRNRELLHDVTEPELYEAALTVMMRLVFLLSAEERGLLLMGDERYEANYALSTLRMQLRKESDEILERRWDAWSRLLAIFRAVFGGIEHENLRLPALGGSLFNPDRFPFLEGRGKGSNWRNEAAKPLPIDNRTVLLLLEAIQQYQGRTLSYRALDVEQIGYVYEGLLERTVKRTEEVTLELDATKGAKKPWVKLAELDSARLDGAALVANLLQERSGSSASRVKNDLARTVDDALADRLLTVCQGDSNLRDRIKPYAYLLRTDPWGYPLVYPAGAFVVTSGSDRRESGTHYTPKSLTEAIVAETLTPVVYFGPAEGLPRNQWALKSPTELLDLKICDPAMGSGAFLVQACRWLSDRLVEAWSQVETTGKTVSVDGEVLDIGAATEPLPRDSEARTVIARRLIAECCLYGVDLNPLAVELAKLSIWLVTLAKGRPFGFLDHNLRCGDSLLGIHRLDQLTELSMTPGGKGQQRLFGKNIENAVHEAMELRHRLRELPIRDIRDIESVAQLNAESHRLLEVPELIADAFVAEMFSTSGRGSNIEALLSSLAIQAGQAISGDKNSTCALKVCAQSGLSVDLVGTETTRRPFHWPLEFPEVFSLGGDGGFDAIIGNPPFLGGKKISGVSGVQYRNWLFQYIANGRRGSADLSAYFFLRAYSTLKQNGHFGLLAVNTIAEGETREVGLEGLVSHGASIRAANPNKQWPGKAAVLTSQVFIYKGAWAGKKILSGEVVSHISPFLSGRDEWKAMKLEQNSNLSFVGSFVLGLGFLMTEECARKMIQSDEKNKEVLYPYLNGEDLNTNSDQRPSRWAVNFWDWPEEIAAGYIEPYQKVLNEVKPERQRKNEQGKFVLRKPLPERWWQFADKRPALYHKIGQGNKFMQHPKEWTPTNPTLSRVLVIPETTKYCTFSFCPTNILLSSMLKIITLDDFASFSVLASTIHEVWTRTQSSTLETRLKYNPSVAFETFPFPANYVNNSSLSSIGEQYCELRKSIMIENNIGITKLYNAFHDPNVQDLKFIQLRNLHKALDECVLSAYGWQDLCLDHNFLDVPYLAENDRLRFTISENSRFEILHRLSEFNRQLYEEETSRDVRASMKIESSAMRVRRGVKSDSAIETGDLFDGENA